MRDGFPAVLKSIAGFEREGILPPLFIDQMDALAWLKGGHGSHSRSLPPGLQLVPHNSPNSAIGLGGIPNGGVFLTPLGEARKMVFVGGFLRIDYLSHNAFPVSARS